MSRGILSERPVSKILVVVGVLLLLVNLLVGSDALSLVGWATVLASAVLGAFFDA